MENIYFGNCENCKGNCRECEYQPLVMRYDSIVNGCIPVECLIDTLEMFKGKDVYLCGQPDIQLTIGEDFVNLTPIKHPVPYGEFQF